MNFRPLFVRAVVRSKKLPLQITGSNEPQHQQGDEGFLTQNTEDDQDSADDHRHPDRDDERRPLADDHPEEVPQHRVSVERHDRTEVEESPDDVDSHEKRQQRGEKRVLLQSRKASQSEEQHDGEEEARQRPNAADEEVLPRPRAPLVDRHAADALKHDAARTKTEDADHRGVGELMKEHADEDHWDPEQRVPHPTLNVTQHPEDEQDDEAEVQLDRRPEDGAEVDLAHGLLGYSVITRGQVFDRRFSTPRRK